VIPPASAALLTEHVDLPDAKTVPGLYVSASSIYANIWLIDTPPGVESAAFPGQSDEEKDRLLHMVRLWP
jgi:hypothetical protein